MSMSSVSRNSSRRFFFFSLIRILGEERTTVPRRVQGVRRQDCGGVGCASAHRYRWLRRAVPALGLDDCRLRAVRFASAPYAEIEEFRARARSGGRYGPAVEKTVLAILEVGLRRHAIDPGRESLGVERLSDLLRHAVLAARVLSVLPDLQL